MIVNTITVYVKMYHKFVLSIIITVYFKEIICEGVD